MKRDTTFSKEDFVRLIVARAENNSSSEAVARRYLAEQEIEFDPIISVGLRKISELQERITATKATTSGGVENLGRMQNEHSSSFSDYWTHESVLKLIEESGSNDPNEAIKDRARNLVLEAFEKGWQGPPYDPVILAKFLNIDVVPNDSVSDARTIPLGGSSFQIQYNPIQRPTRRNFSIAHEIAHTLFSDCASAIRNREENPQENRQLEQLCNAAAAEIQLPYAVFSNDANSSPPSIEGLIRLAEKYKASLESVFIRYTEVIDKPCAILIGIFQTDNEITIDYSKSSKQFPIKIPRVLEVPSGSKAYECITPGWTARETAAWDVLGGVEYNIFSIGISPYRRDNKPRVGILIMPTENESLAIDTGKVSIEFGDATKPRGKGNKIIAQVVNTTGSLARGFGRSLVKNYPLVKTGLEEWKGSKRFVLGNSNVVELRSNLFVFQMLAQKGLYPKDNEIPLRYTELRKCLVELRQFATANNCTIHMPAIGAGNAQGDWEIIIGMIHDELVNYNLKVNIYFLPGKPIDKKHKSNLTLFKEESTWVTGKLF